MTDPMEPAEALNGTPHCGTCVRFEPVSRLNWGNCRLLHNSRLVSPLHPCGFRPPMWVPKPGGAVMTEGD